MKILFVCGGNTCRSPLALAAWRSLQNAGHAPKDIMAQSAGLLASEGAPASPHSLAIAKDWGVDLSTHQARPVSSQVVREADAIFVMTSDQQFTLQNSFNLDPEKVHLLGSFTRRNEVIDDDDIHDPFGGSREAYETCANIIRRAVEGVANAIVTGKLGGKNTQ